MADKKRLGKMLQQREAVRPVDRYEPAAAPTTRLGKAQTSKPVDAQTSKEVKKQTSEPLKKFGTWLTPGTIKRVKVFAALEDKHDYEIVEAALVEYLDAHQEQ